MGHIHIKNNDIQVSKSLKYAPDFMIKQVIFHELIHIKFFNHGNEFKKYNCSYKDHEKSELYSGMLTETIKRLGSKWLVENIK